MEQLYYEALIWSLIGNIILLIALLSPNIVYWIHKKFFEWRKDFKNPPL
jgi:hypothetical protein